MTSVTERTARADLRCYFCGIRVICSALGVYSVGKTLREAKRNFEQALDLHLFVLREKATKELTAVAR